MDSSILSLEERITIANSVLVSSIRDLYAACIRAGIDFDTFKDDGSMLIVCIENLFSSVSMFFSSKSLKLVS